YYAINRPVILTGEMDDWPALKLWSPDYLKAKIGAAVIQFQGERTSNARFEMDKDAHRREAPFTDFIDRIQTPGAGNETYLTAYNSATNEKALASLSADVGPLDKFLDPAGAPGMPWIGPAGTLTSLHHDLTNNLIAQVVGRKRVKLLPAAEAGKLYNHRHVFSEVPDLDAADLDLARYPLLRRARIYDVVLAPGEILFVPVAWWHQVRALDFSVTLTFTNFRWRNDMARDFPPG
ncbi:MAG TPA: cupin-like domain-containing protein, partial [Caulobacteraceae bacterium]|nr:cupin-like domain-containing protein [Caulobacteraceae bacterium]